jgi:N-acetylmuramoyl-L-alanine amidase
MPVSLLKCVALALTLLLAGCVSGPPVDTRYHAVSQNSRVQFIILHFTGETFADSLHILTKEDVSSHYLVGEDPPTIYRLVDEDQRAWHAGKSYWQGQTALNSASIGIEIVNLGDHDHPGGPFAPYAPEQIDRVVDLVRDVQRRHQVRPDRILGHSDIQPQTKTDPGPMFPWRRLADEGLIPWPDANAVALRLTVYKSALPDVAWFQQKLSQFGFDVPQNGQLDPATRNVIAAFQMKYRPLRYDGEPDAETAALLDVVTTPGGMLIHEQDGSWKAYVSQ